MNGRDDVLDAALVQLNQNPASSMAELAEAMGMSRATLHRHFASRGKLIEELAERGLTAWAQAQEEAGIVGADRWQGSAARSRDAVESMMVALLRRYVTDGHTFAFLLTDTIVEQIPSMASRTEKLIDIEAAFFARAQDVGLLRRDVPPRWHAHSAYGVLIAAREAIRAGDVALRGIDDLVITTFLQGARSHEQ
ncbi:TetR family transcriptional regulator [Williamsia limnetica]|uniref:TetR family transcriptional regulator n=1 Tax=Williamsia limnetica TaxID=882452 RepID=A0A318REZ6_WILLI|nr:TetR/AcrR family transcriptional regulator [Williamsia limnetica]PYE12299.1 TetR family transcriptional regulator [Williamsia limnetica]